MTKFEPNAPIKDDTFEITGLGLPQNSRVWDFVSGVSYKYRLEDSLPEAGPTAEAFRQARAKAADENRKLQGIIPGGPNSAAGEEQRQRTVEAFERAVACMPEARECPSLLLRAAHLWTDCRVAASRPEEALKVYERVEREYPDARQCFLRALAEQAVLYWSLGQSEKSDAKASQFLDNKIPNTADGAFPDGLGTEVKIRYKARKLGLTTVDGVPLDDLSKLDWKVRNKVLEAIDAIEKAPGQKPPVEDDVGDGQE